MSFNRKNKDILSQKENQQITNSYLQFGTWNGLEFDLENLVA